MDYTYIKLVRGQEGKSPGGFMRYENEDGRNKSDVGGSSESFLKAPRVTRQVYAETSIISLTCFIASWANSAVPVLRFTAFVFSFFLLNVPTPSLLFSLVTHHVHISRPKCLPCSSTPLAIPSRASFRSGQGSIYETVNLVVENNHVRRGPSRVHSETEYSL